MKEIIFMYEAHYGPMGGHFQVDTTAKKIQQSRLWWATLYKYCNIFVIQCDRCQRLGRPLPSIEIPLILVNPSLTFEIWAIDFIGPFPIPRKRTGARYIITVVEYVTKWAEAEPVDTCSSVKRVAATESKELQSPKTPLMRRLRNIKMPRYRKPRGRKLG